MNRKWMIGLGVGLLATATLVTVGATAYRLGERDDRVLVTGTEMLDGTVIVRDGDWGHHGWGHGGPGFLIFPLLVVGAVLLFAGRRRRGWGDPGYGCGPGYRGDPGYHHGAESDWRRDPDRQRERSTAPPPSAPDDDGVGPPPA